MREDRASGLRPRASGHLPASLVTVAALGLAAGCWAHQDPHAADTQRRIAALEQQVASQQRQLDDLRRVVTAAPEVGAMAHRVAELEDRVQALQQRPVAPAPRPRRPAPDPSDVYAVAVAGSPALGSPRAKVTIVMAEDFACPFCREAQATLDELRKRYGADLRVVYRSFVVHPQVAKYPAEAACAANHQGKWKRFADLVWTQAFDTGEFEPSHIDDLARQAGLDMTRYRTDVTGLCPGEIQRDAYELTKLGVSATPTFFINGHYFVGAQPVEAFARVIDRELAKAQAAIASGTRPDQIYQVEVLAKGHTELVPAKAPTDVENPWQP